MFNDEKDIVDVEFDVVIGLFLMGCAPALQDGSEDAALAGQAVNTNYLSCKDSDGGKEFYAAGEATYTYNSGPNTRVSTKTSLDKCVNGQNLQEWYCSGKRPLFLNKKCDGVCKDGACVSPVPVVVCDSAKITLKQKEIIGIVKPTLNNADLPVLLASGNAVMSSGIKVAYDQQIDLSKTAYIDFKENDDDVQDNFLYFSSGKEIGTYKLKFSTPLTSKVTLSNGEQGTKGYYVMNDLVGTKIKILGKEYTIDKAYRPGGTDSKAIMLLLTDGVSNLKLQDENSGVGSTYRVYVDNKDIDGTYLDLIWTESTDSIAINEINVKMSAEDDYFVAAGKELSSVIYSAGDEPQILFTNAWDIKLNGYDTSTQVGKVEIGNCNLKPVPEAASYCATSVPSYPCDAYIANTDKWNVPGWGKVTFLGSNSFIGRDELPTILADNVFGECTSYRQYFYATGGYFDGTAFNFNKSQDFAKYVLEFTKPAESTLGDSEGYLIPTGENLLNFKNEKLFILGKNYTVTEAKYTNGLVKLVLSDSQHTFELKDGNISDDKWLSQVIYDGTPVEGTKVKIQGSVGSGIVKLFVITIEMSATDNFQLTEGKKLSEVITAAGKDPNVLFTNNWDVKYNSYDATTGTASVSTGSIC